MAVAAFGVPRVGPAEPVRVEARGELTKPGLGDLAGRVVRGKSGRVTDRAAYGVERG